MFLYGNDCLKEINLFESKLKIDWKLFGKLIYYGLCLKFLKVFMDSCGKELEKFRCNCII